MGQENIGVNVNQDLSFQQAAAKKNSGKIINDGYDFAAVSAAVAGPAAVSALSYTKEGQAAAITGAAANAAAGNTPGIGLGYTPGAYSGAGLASSPYGYHAGGLGLMKTAHVDDHTVDPVNPGSASNNMAAEIEAMMAEGAQTNGMFLIWQQNMSMQSQQYQALSNVMSAKDSMHAAIIRNIKTA